MKIMASRLSRIVAISVVASLVATCGLPRVGPNKREIYAGSVLKQGDAFIVAVNPRVTRATAVAPALGFSTKFKNAGVVGSDTIRSGDRLGLQIYENVDDGLLAVPLPFWTKSKLIAPDLYSFLMLVVLRLPETRLKAFAV